MGSITPYETAAGKRYRVRYRKPDQSQTDKRGFRTKREAELYLASVEIAKNTGRYIDPSRSRVTVGDWIDDWLSSRADLKTSTKDRVAGAIRNHIKPQLGNVPLGDLERLDVQRWASKLSDTQGPWSVRKIVNVLSGSLQLAVEDGRLATNPAQRLKLPRVTKTQKKYLSHEQVAALATEVASKSDAGYGLVILVLAYCGLRWSELAGLHVRDFDAKRERLHVRTTMVETNGYIEESTPKDYEERFIPIPNFIATQLERYVAGKKPADLVFVGSRGGGVLRNRIFRRGWFDAAATKIGVPGLTPHEMRHTCASLAVSAGANVKALQRMLGHASAKETLDTYSDLFDSDLNSVAEALNEVVATLNVGKMWANASAQLVQEANE